MSKCCLKIIAGCNGSGKSTYSKAFVKGITPFDFDARFQQKYLSMPDSELRYEIAQKITIDEFESSIKGAFSLKKDFCYETNFDSHPVTWAKKAIEYGYTLELVFFCLDSLDTARERVLTRTRNNGHFVNNETVFRKWKDTKI